MSPGVRGHRTAAGAAPVSAPVWLVAQGAGAGEAAFAACFRRAAMRAGLEVAAFAHPESARRVLGSPCEPLPPPGSLAARAASEGPTLVVLSSSLTCAPWIEALPPGPLIASLEYTWLMWAQGRPRSIEPVSRSWVFLPNALFERGLREPGGIFSISSPVRERLLPVGWPEPAPQVAPADEVLLYLGQRVPGESFAWAQALAPAIERVAIERPDLRWRYVGDRAVALPGLVERVPWLEPGTFREAVARAALVVCHHGMATIATAAAAGTPVVALTDGVSWRAGAGPAWADQELVALESGGIVRACHGRAPAEALARRMRIALRGGRGERPAAEGADLAIRSLREWIGA